MIRFDTVAQYNEYHDHETLHPLVSFLDLMDAGPRQRTKMFFGLYLISLKRFNDTASRLRYGVNYYDFQEGTLVFFAPGQIVHIEPDGEWFNPSSLVLVFHPDLLHGTSLGKTIGSYSFFSYQSNEALHVSQREREAILNCFENIQTELQRPIDKHSKQLIVSNIELILNYCTRFYERQFETRQHVHSGILEKFETLLNEYFQSEKPQALGLPSVAYFAQALNLSANYFGDMVRKAGGQSAQDIIQQKIIDIAKVHTLDSSRQIAEISHGLGFKYPQHFTRFFKQKTGLTPQAYRRMG